MKFKDKNGNIIIANASYQINMYKNDKNYTEVKEEVKGKKK